MSTHTLSLNKTALSSGNVPLSDLGFELTGAPTISPDVKVGGSTYAEASVNLTTDYAVGAGLTGVLHLDPGTANATYSFDPHATSASAPGGAVIDTSGYTVGPASFAVSGLNLANTSVDLGLHGNLSVELQGSASAKAGVDIKTAFGRIKDSTSKSANFDQKLFNFSGTLPIGTLSAGQTPEITIPVSSWGVVKVDMPKAVTGSTTQVTGAGLGSLNIAPAAQTFAHTSMDIPNFLEWLGVEFASGGTGDDNPDGGNIPPLDGSINLADLGIANVGISYHTLDAALEDDASLTQDYTFTPHVTASMTSSFGQTLTGNLGDKFTFNTPQGQGSFKVTATYDLQGTLTDSIGLLLTSNLDYEILQFGLNADVSVKVAGYGISKNINLGAGPAAQGVVPIVSEPITLDTTSTNVDLGKVTESYTVSYENFVDGSSGNNLHMTTHQTQLVGNDNGDSLFGNALNDTIIGGAGNDVITSGVGTNTLYGGGGKNIFKAALGSNTIYGDGGNVQSQNGQFAFIPAGPGTLDYSAATAPLTVDLAQGTVTKPNGTDHFSNIENFIGGSGNDTFILGIPPIAPVGAPPNAGAAPQTVLVNAMPDVENAFAIDGGGGTNTAVFASPLSAYTFTHSTNTSLIVNDVTHNVGDSLKNIQMVSFAGQLFNVINEPAGQQNIALGSANDIVGIPDGDHTIGFTTGTVLVQGGIGNETVNGGNGQAALRFGNGNHTITLGDGNDFVITGTGTDNVALGNGHYSVNLGNGDKTVTAGNGGSIIAMGAGTDSVTVTGGTNSIAVGIGTNTVQGGGGNDTITVGSGTNTITGGGGNDMFNLGSGHGTVIGGTGNDVFEILGGQYSITTGGGMDDLVFNSPLGHTTVTDFSLANNHLTFSDAAFNLGVDEGHGTAAHQAIDPTLLSSHTNGTFAAAGNRFAYNQQTGALYYDADGSGAAAKPTLIASLTGHPQLTAANFDFVS